MQQKKPLKFFIIAGEPSGDLHGAKLINAIKSIEKNSSFMGHGGDLMRKEGMKIIEHINNLSIMGFKEVIIHLPKIFNIMNKTIHLIKKVKPDRIILIDYPGFNLKIAKKIRCLKIPISYFILPQAWAWKSNRVKIMRRTIDQSFSIFPFEKKWYQSKGLPVKYFGHPFIEDEHVNESTKQFYKRHNLNPNYPLLTLLPGSRQQEINRHWPVFVKTMNLIKKKYPNIQILLAKSDNVVIENIPKDYKVENNSKKAILAASATLVASGTATLECAIAKIPMVVCYKLSNLSWLISQYLIKIKFISIVNLIAEKKIVPEFLQFDMNPQKMQNNLVELLDINSEKRNIMIQNLNKVKKQLGTPGVYKKIAGSILQKTIKD